MGDNKQRERGCGGGGYRTISSKILHLRNKIFYMKVIREEQGTILKVTELFCNHRSSQIDLSLSAAKEMRDRLDDLVEFYVGLLSVSRIPAELQTILKSVKIGSDGERKRYSLNFMENSRGRFLKICQTSSISGDIGWVKYFVKKRINILVIIL